MYHRSTNPLFAAGEPRRRIARRKALAVTRKVVYRADPRFPDSGSVSVNDELGLEPFCSYEIPEYLCDLETHDGLRLVSIKGSLFRFEGGEELRLEEREEPIDVERLDSETLLVMLTSFEDACLQD